MEKFIINGRKPLNGEITPAGNKNSALPLLAACLLTDEPVILKNMPRIQDVFVMRSLIESLGAKVDELESHTWKITADEINSVDMDPELVKKIRASILLVGPLIARTGELFLTPPGGDVIGRRRVDTHFLAIREMGASAIYDVDQKKFHFKAEQGLTGADMLLDEASVTATENAIMAASLADGVSYIRNAASEPHIQELCQMLNSMGAKIEHIGSNILKIIGVKSLHGTEFTIGPDYLEVVSYIGAAVMTGGEIRIKNAGTQYLHMVKLVFNRLGIDWDEDGDDIIVPKDQKKVIEADLGDAIPEIKVMPWPAFPPDLMSIAIVVATQCHGSILFHDWMYNSRMFFTDKLVSMGAQIVLCDPHRVIVNGPTKLIGEIMDSPDIRAGMALVLAALASKGESEIRNINQIKRGYENVYEKMKSLGADITVEID